MNAKLNKCRRKLSAFSAAWDEVAERWRAVSITERQPNSEKKKKRIFFGGEIQFTLIYIRISSRSVVIFPRAHSAHTRNFALRARYYRRWTKRAHAMRSSIFVFSLSSARTLCLLGFARIARKIYIHEVFRISRWQRTRCNVQQHAQPHTNPVSQSQSVLN